MDGVVNGDMIVGDDGKETREARSEGGQEFE